MSGGERVSVADMALSHFSQVNILTPRSVAQDSARRGDKPQGLWVSVDGEDDWPSWCQSEEWGLEGLRHRFRVTLDDEANVLLITNPGDLLAFDAEFGEKGTAPRQRRWDVSWEAVAELWQGIIIAPYLWSCRLGDPSWYYTLGLRVGLHLGRLRDRLGGRCRQSRGCVVMTATTDLTAALTRMTRPDPRAFVDVAAVLAWLVVVAAVWAVCHG